MCFSVFRLKDLMVPLVTFIQISLEIQFMRKIMTSKFCDSFSEFLHTNNEFQFYDVFFKEADSLKQYKVTDVIKFLKLSESVNGFLSRDIFTFVTVPKVYKLPALDSEDIVTLMTS